MPYTLTYRSVKGSPLTSAEGDGNIHNLDDRITELETTPPEAISIEDVTVSGDQLTFLMTDSTTRGPITVSVSTLNPRGSWATDTVYAVQDFFLAPDGQSYVVIFPHTSDPTTFDPAANDGGGHDYYQLLFAIPTNAIPVGGGVGFNLAKTTTADYDTEWLDNGVPAGGDVGDVLTKSGVEDYAKEWSPPTFVSAPVEIADTAFTPDLTDANKYFRCTNASGCSVTIPLHANIEFNAGTELHFRQCDAGAVVLEGEEDSTEFVILNPIIGYMAATELSGAVLTAKKIADNEWDVWGLLAADASA